MITSVGVTSDNKYIVSGSWDKTIGVWDIAGKNLLHRFEQAQEIIEILVVSQGSSVLDKSMRRMGDIRSQPHVSSASLRSASGTERETLSLPLWVGLH
jgi:WD40 repeat protein